MYLRYYLLLLSTTKIINFPFISYRNRSYYFIITPASSPPHKPNHLFDFYNLALNQAIGMDSTALPWTTTDYSSRL